MPVNAQTIQMARDSGYTDSQIRDYIVNSPEYTQAKQAGYGDNEIFSHLGFKGAQRNVEIQGKPDASAAETERMKQEFLQSQGGTAERIKQNAKSWLTYLGSPTAPAEDVSDFATRVVPASAAKTAYGVLTAPYQMVKRVTDPLVDYAANITNPDPNRKPLGRQLDTGLKQTVMDTAAFAGKPLGFKPDESGGLSWSPSNIKEAILTDPVGTALAGAPLAKPVLKGAAKTLSTVGSVGADTLGVTTGMQRGVKQSFEAGKRAGSSEAPTTDFADYYTGKKGQEDLLNSYKDVISDLKDKRASEYQGKLAEIAKNKQQLDISPIIGKWNEFKQKYGIATDAEGNVDLSRSTLSRKDAGDLSEITDMLDSWGTRPNDLTPVGLDLLKRKLDNLYTESKDSRAIVTGLRNAVKNTIVDAVPEYADMTKGYADATGLLNEAQSALSLKNKVAGDTALRKINQVMRENFDFRRETINKLEEQTGANLLDQTAGYQASQWLPRGALGKVIGGGEAAALFHAGLAPSGIAALALSSPKLVGGMMYGLGISVGMAKRIVAKLPQLKAWMQKTGQLPKMQGDNNATNQVNQ